MKQKLIIVINEQHSMLPEQESILKEKFPHLEWEFKKIPAKGITIKEQRIEGMALVNSTRTEAVVFVSPIPIMLGVAANTVGYEQGHEQSTLVGPAIYVFANGKREKRELPNGKVISTVAHTGWELVLIS